MEEEFSKEEVKKYIEKKLMNFKNQFNINYWH